RNASEISFLGKVPRPKTYGAIRGLESKGLLRIVPGKPERYMAVSPNDVLIPLVEKLNKETTECVQVVENLAMAFESSRYVYTEKAAERGAKVRVAAPINQINQSVARELGEVIEVRNSSGPMVKFLTADSAEIIFTEDIPDDTNVATGQDVATWTNDPLLVKAH